MTDAETFADWVQRLFPPPHSDAKAARALGLHRSQVHRLRTGRRPLTRLHRLAMTAIAHGLQPYGRPPD